MSNGFDPVSFSAGIGAGEEATNRANSATQNAEHTAALARIDAESARSIASQSQDTVMALAIAAKQRQVEIESKWIPYANKLQASIFAHRTQKEDLIAALKASDPTNADRIVEESKRHALAEYARVTQPGSEALKKIHEETLREAEDERLDR